MNVQVFVRCVTEAASDAEDDDEIPPTQRDPNVPTTSTIPCPAPATDDEGPSRDLSA